MGKFDYPSPYWDSIGDPALDLIDRMLTVDVDERIGIDECLEHPWLTGKPMDSIGIDPTDSQSTVTSVGNDGVSGHVGRSQDSLQSLSSHLRKLDFSKRKPARERTLLSSINDIKISKIVEVPDAMGGGGGDNGEGGGPYTQQPVKVFEKHVEGKRCYDTQGKTMHAEAASERPVEIANGDGDGDGVDGVKGSEGKGKKEEGEAKPDAARGVGEFMELGGKGDPALF